MFYIPYMSLSLSDIFAYSSQKELLREPLFRSDLQCGHFEPMGQDFINWFLEILKNHTHEYPYLSSWMGYSIRLHTNNNEINLNSFLQKLSDIETSENEELKKEFLDLVSSMELSLNRAYGNKVRRILWMWNWVDFAQYRPWISGIWKDTSVKQLLRFWLKSSEHDKNRTLPEELLEDIWVIASRVNELLWKSVISEKWTIWDDSIGLFSALDWYSEWEVFLTIHWEIIDAKPPQWEWNK